MDIVKISLVASLLLLGQILWADFESPTGSNKTYNIEVIPGNHTFVITGIWTYRKTEWYYKGILYETDISRLINGYANPRFTVNILDDSRVDAFLEDDKGSRVEQHTWNVRIKRYSVIYNGNGATSGTPPAAQEKVHGQNLTIQANTGNLAKSGYSFSGWNTNPNGTGSNYPPGSTYTTNSALTLYAKWVADPYVITYHANNATSGTPPASQVSITASNVFLRNNTGKLARTGYVFDGWNTRSDGRGTKYPEGGSYFLSASVVLYADWRVLPLPEKPELLSPSNKRANVPLSVTFYWAGGDYTDTFAVFLGASSNRLQKIRDNIRGTSYGPVILLAGQRYYWQVVAEGPGGTSSSEIWYFDTIPSEGLARPPAPVIINSGVIFVGDLVQFAVPTYYSTYGNALEARFDFNNDGIADTNWANIELAVDAQKSFDIAGTYPVRVQTRVKVNTDLVSAWSDPVNVNVVPKPVYRLEVRSTNPSGGVIISSSNQQGGSTSYTKTGLTAGFSANLTAPEYHGAGIERKAFSNWSGSINSTDQTINVVMDADKTVIANYVDVSEPAYLNEYAIRLTNETQEVVANGIQQDVSARISAIIHGSQAPVSVQLKLTPLNPIFLPQILPMRLDFWGVWIVDMPFTYAKAPGFDFIIEVESPQGLSGSPKYRVNVFETMQKRAPVIQFLGNAEGRLSVSNGIPHTVTARITDEDGSIVAADLYYRVGAKGADNRIAMSPSSGDWYSATIPGLVINPGQEVYFLIYAEDNDGLAAVFPTDGEALVIWGILPQEDRPSAKEADPIDLSNGDYRYQKVIFNQPGIGLNTFLAVNYTSLDPMDLPTPMGPGWSHNWNWQLFHDGVNTVQLIDGEGMIRVFLTDVDGNFVNYTPGDFSRLERTGSEHNTVFELTQPDQIRFRFDWSWLGYRLTQIRDRHGNQIDLAYHSLTFNNPSPADQNIIVDGKGQLATVTDTVGRVYTFQYTTDHKLHRVNFPNKDGRYIEFGYNPTTGNLISLRDHGGRVTTYSYFDDHRIKDIVLPEGNTLLANQYDSRGRAIRQTDGDGKVWSILYETPEVGQTTVMEPNGAEGVYVHDGMSRWVSFVKDWESSSFAYNDSNQLESIRPSPDREPVRLEYDGPNLAEIVDPLQRRTSFTFNAANDPTGTQVRGPDGKVLKESVVEYDPSGQLPISVTDFDGDTTRFEYDPDGRGLVIKVTDATGKSVRMTYTPTGRVETLRTHSGRVTRFVYDARDRLIEEYQAWGTAHESRITYGWDDADNLISVKDPLNRTTVYTYDKNDRMRTVAYPGGHTLTYTYDNADRVESVTNNLGETVEYRYTPLSQIKRIDYPNGSFVEYTYDKTGRVTKMTAPFGRNGMAETTFGYDIFGNVIEQTDPLGRRFHFTYDELDRLIKVELEHSDAGEPRVVLADHEFDLLGNLRSSINARDAKDTFGYTASGLLSTYTDALGHLSRYERDELGRIIGVRNPAGIKIATYTYDGDGYLISQIDGAGAESSWTYNSAGDLESFTNRRGQTTAYTMDALGRPELIVEAEGATTISYHALGTVETITDAIGTITYTYDAIGRVLSRTDVFGNTVGYRWNEGGQLEAVIYPDLQEVRYTYDTAGRLETMVDWNDNTFRYTYDAVGNLQSLIYPNGVTESRGYDFLGYMETLTHKAAVQSGGVFGADEAPVGIDIGFSYKRDNEGIIEELFLEGGLGYRPEDTFTDSFRHDPATYRLTSVNGQAASYDADGNLTSVLTRNGTLSFGYDSRNRLVSVTGPEVSATFVYDAEGRRVQSTINGVTTRFVWDVVRGIGNVLAETSGGQTTRFLHGSSLVGQQQPSGDWFYLHADHVYNVIAVTDAGGMTAAQYAYGLFGERLAHPANRVHTPYGFVGALGVRDEADGLLFMRARHYLTDIRLFLQEDPAGLHLSVAHGINPYSYSFNNPLLYVDPDGELPFLLIPAALIAVNVAMAAWDAYEVHQGYKEKDFARMAWGTGGLALTVVPGSGVARGGAKAIRAFGSNKKISMITSKTGKTFTEYLGDQVRVYRNKDARKVLNEIDFRGSAVGHVHANQIHHASNYVREGRDLVKYNTYQGKNTKWVWDWTKEKFVEVKNWFAP